MAKEMFTGFGVRTLATDMAAYNPMSYHNGSVWPHDNAIIAAGLMRYGFVGAAQMIAVGLVDAAESFGHRLPELFCGFDRSEFADPVAYPAACSPQAWSSASLFSLVRTLLRFDPLVPSGRLWIAPQIPSVFGELSLDNVPLNGFRLSVEASGDSMKVDGLPEHFELIHEHFPVDRFTVA
jgi:glycogen debranching enzyme